MKVLVIDDCDELLEVVTEILRNEGHEVTGARGSDEAKSLWQITSFDLVICDLVMPLEDGMEQEFSGESAMVGLQAIHEFSTANPMVPIIAISGELVGTPLSAIQRFGAVTTLAKPFGRDDLLRAIDRARCASRPHPSA